MTEFATERAVAPLPSGTVAFLFSDIEGSTQRWESHRAAMTAAIERHDAIVQAAIEPHHGYVFKKMGDAFCAAFRTAPEAVAAALEAQLALAKEDFSAVDGLKVRMAVHAGDADEREGDYFGPAVNRVARLLGIGYGGQVLVSGAAADLAMGEMPPQATLHDLGAHRLKDLTQPEQVYQLLAPGLQQKFFPLRSLETLPTNLPLQVTSFVGRDGDLAEIEALLAKTRLLTLVGTGGVGKTRLSLQLGANVLDAYPDGVWFVEFAPLVDGELIPSAIASIFGVTEQPGRTLTDVLLHALRNKSALLVFDNCEHLVTPAAKMADAIIRAAPRVRILATSREGLGIAGETVHRVASLALPAADATSADGAQGYGSVTLFVERAAAANTHFALTDENAKSVTEICRRLDGIPLAIELAATRIRTMSVEQLAKHLDERFRILTGGSRTAVPRQQTMRALIDWSYDLLGENERTVFRRVAVFAAGWDLDAANAICSDESLEAWEVLDILSSLAEKSMIVVELDGSEQRYRLLESTRQYALEKLEGSGERAHLRQLHAQYFLQLLLAARTKENETPIPVWIAPLAAEIDNFRLALDWFLTEKRDVESGARLAAELYDVFRETSREAESWRWLQEARAAIGDDGSPELVAPVLLAMSSLANSLTLGTARQLALATGAAERFRVLGDRAGLARALTAIGFCYGYSGRRDEARPAVSEALEIARGLKDRRTIAYCLSLQGGFLVDAIAEKRKIMGEAAALYRACGDLRGEGRTLSWLAEDEFAAGNVQQALALASESAALSRRAILRTSLAVITSNIAAYNLAFGSVDAARRAAREALAILQEVQLPRTTVWACIHLANVAAENGKPHDAARLIGFCDAQIATSNLYVESTERWSYDRATSLLRERLSEAELRDTTAEGATLSTDDAIDLALHV